MRCTGNCYNCNLCSVKVISENLLGENREELEENFPILESNEEVFTLTKQDIQEASEAFDRPIETGLSVIEVPQYELKKNIFGKEKVKRIK